MPNQKVLFSNQIKKLFRQNIRKQSTVKRGTIQCISKSKGTCFQTERNKVLSSKPKTYPKKKNMAHKITWTSI